MTENKVKSKVRFTSLAEYKHGVAVITINDITHELSLSSSSLGLRKSANPA